MRTRMRQICIVVGLVVAAVAATLAQNTSPGQIAGTVRDAQGGVVPGVLVEVASPALVEKIRSTKTDTNGQYRLASLPAGAYSVTFTLEGFIRQQHNVVVTSGFTAAVNATLAVGQLAEALVVTAAAPTVDVQNSRQAVTFEGEQLRALPTARSVDSLLNLTPGISSRDTPGVDRFYAGDAGQAP